MIETTTINMIIAERLYITLFLISGFQIKGHILSQDDKTIIMSSMGSRRQLIYKQAISTIEF